MANLEKSVHGYKQLLARSMQRITSLQLVLKKCVCGAVSVENREALLEEIDVQGDFVGKTNDELHGSKDLPDLPKVEVEKQHDHSNLTNGSIDTEVFANLGKPGAIKQNEEPILEESFSKRHVCMVLPCEFLYPFVLILYSFYQASGAARFAIP